MAMVGAPELGEQCGCLGGWYSLLGFGDMRHRPDRGRCKRTEKTPPEALPRVPAVPLLAAGSNTITGEAQRPRLTRPDRATSAQQAQTRLYAPFTCKVGVSSEERLCKKSGLVRSECGGEGRPRCTDAPQPLGRRNGLCRAS